MILIVGCGFLGSHLLKYASAQTDEKILATVRSLNNIVPIKDTEYMRCDVADMSDLIALAEKCDNEPLTVFYLAACHNVDYVYENPDRARRINVEALKNFFDIIPNIKKFFFASTDCVYGEGRNLNESSPLNPVNEYGRQKIEAEQIVLSKGFTVLRLPFMLGPSLIARPHFYDNICSKLLRGEPVEMIDGMRRSVLSFSQTAQLIYSLSNSTDETPQIINVSSDSELSKYETGLILAKKFGASPETVKSITEKEAQKFFKDKRASCSSMDNSLLKSLLGLKEIKWDTN